MQYKKEIETAIDAVRKASLVCRSAQQQLVTLEMIEKGDRSPVTVADFASQAVVKREIFRVFPDDAVLGEEDTDLLRGQSEILDSISALTDAHGLRFRSGEILDLIDRGQTDAESKNRFWTVDPIDGTKGFLRGDQYAVALALIENGSVVLGVLGCPNMTWSPDETGDDGGCLFYSAAGEGSHQMAVAGSQQKISIAIDGKTDPANAVFCESVESAHASHDTHARIAKNLGVAAPACRMDSQAKYAAVARGQASIYLRLPRSLDYREKIWDHAAGSLLVREAGGRVTDFFGRPLDFSRGKTLMGNRGVIASNGIFHDGILDAIQQCGDEFRRK